MIEKRFNKLTIFGTKDHIVNYLDMIIKFKHKTFEGHSLIKRLSVMIISDDIFSCSIALKRDKINFILNYDKFNEFAISGENYIKQGYFNE